MTSLVRSTSGRQAYRDDGLHSAASESGDGRHSASDESTEIAQVIDTQPGNTIPFPTSGVAATPPTVIETNIVQPPITDQDNENQTWEENGAGSRRHSTSVTEPGNTIPIPTSGAAAAPPTTIEINVVQPPITGNRTASRTDRQSMYKAAFKGDWRTAEILLKKDPSLACAEITERGDRALHVAVAFKHTKFVQKLVQRMSPTDLESLDWQGQTACCYAALSGNVEIAEVMMEKNPNLVTESDIICMTPLYKAALRGNAKMVSYFLKSIKVKHLSKEAWFNLFLVTVRSKMYGVALEMLEKDGSLAIMRDDDEGTALHMLARLDLSDVSTSKEPTLLEIYFGRDVALNCFPGKMQPDLRSLAENLWVEIQRFGQAGVLELIREPPILHDAAKVGNVELITMLTSTYPDLIWDIDSKGYTIFHIAVIHRQENVFRLIHQTGAMKDLIGISQDDDGNNILHLAGKLASLEPSKIASQPALQMHRELAWFKDVEKIVPPLYLETINDDGYKPRELFSMQHKDLLEKSETWMRSTSDSCMLIATIVLTVVFAAAFTPPGGNNSETGIPILLKKTPTLFAIFVISEGIAMVGSIFSIMMFWSIMTSSFEEHQFLRILPYQLKWGLYGLLGWLTGAISAFMSAYLLVFVDKRARLVYSFAALAYLSLLSVICSKFINLWAKIRSRQIRHSLFSYD